jgi:hypothetical protein
VGEPTINRYAKFQAGDQVIVRRYDNKNYRQKLISTEYGVVHQVMKERAYVKLDDGKLVTRSMEHMEKVELK